MEKLLSIHKDNYDWSNLYIFSTSIYSGPYNILGHIISKLISILVFAFGLTLISVLWGVEKSELIKVWSWEGT